MREYAAYFVVPAVCAMLCVIAGGGLKKAAGWLIGHIPGLGKVAGAEILSKAMMILLAADLLAALSVWSGGQEDTAAKGYLLRGGYGSGTEKETLRLDLDGEEHTVALNVDAKKLGKGEIEKLLEEASAEVKETALGGQDPEHVVRALNFEKSFCSGKVTAEWLTSHPEYIDWDGSLGDIPESGAEVALGAYLACADETREISFSVRVYPEELGSEEKLSRDVAKIINETNSETEEKVVLPAEVLGKKASWSDPEKNTGPTLLFLGVIIAVFFVYAQIRKQQEAEELRRENLLLDYPHIVSRIVLLNAAGLGMRKSFEKVRSDYGESLAAGGGSRPGYDEIVRTCAEMEHGVPEREAYINLGKRSGLAEYRTFSALLVENLTKGGDGIAKILRKEADRAFDERKKHANEQGEKAGTKLLMPMMLLLIIVMAILMVPALVAFY